VAPPVRSIPKSVVSTIFAFAVGAEQ